MDVVAAAAAATTTKMAATTLDWRQLGKRCDMNGLLKDGRKYHVNLQEDYVVQHHTSIDRIIEIQDTSTEYGLPHEYAILFAWHKTLNVFAGGETTALLVSDSTQQSDKHIELTCTSVFDHLTSIDQSCSDAIEIVSQFCRMTSSIRTCQVDSHVHFIRNGGCSSSLKQLATHFLTIIFEPNWRYTLLHADELFPVDLMTAFCGTFEMVLTTALLESSRVIRDLEYITPSQAQRLDEWNSTDGDYDRTLRLNNLIERSVIATPQKTAVVYKDRSVSFQQLNEKANQLAHYLRDCIRVETEQIVGLFLSKSELMIIVVLSIWKSGAAYTPVDVTYPDERVLFSLEDTGTKILLTTEAHAERARRITSHLPHLTVVVLETILEDVAVDDLRWSTSNPSFDLRSDQLCYLTYTSGTTGRPKGIKKRHTNVVNSITNIADRYQVRNGREAVVLFSPYVFEPFARQTLIALANSQTLVVVDDDVKFDPVAFSEFLCKERITYLNGTASVLLEYDYSKCPDLKRLVLVGEDLTETRYKALRKKFKHRIINEYGFTESAFVTAIKIFEPTSNRPNRSLGRPLRNVKCYILDSQLKRLPPGAIGGLYIGGQGIAEGYWNRPELTSEKFLPNPFQTAEEKRRGANSRIYYTGDLARWIPGVNEVEYCGRIDFQIKLRGIRIEPGEIESILSTHENVSQAIVVAKTAADTKSKSKAAPTMHLIGYWTGRATEENDLISFLQQKLPRYMVPTRLIQIPRVPVTINGKIDFRALPDVALTPQQSNPKIAPENAMESALRTIWAELLSLPEESFGTQDSFFSLGGNSIIAIQLVGRVRRRLSCRTTVEQVFISRTIERLGKTLKPMTAKQETPKKSAPISPESIGVEQLDCKVYLANSLQQGFVYHYLKNGGHDVAYTMQTVCKYATCLDVARYRQSWEAVQRQSSTLRLRLISSSQIYQVIDREAILDFRIVNDGTMGSFDGLMQQDLLEPYNLEKGPLFRVSLVGIAENEYMVLFSAHHAILDGWSVPMLLDRVHEYYVDGDEQALLTGDEAFHATQQLAADLSEEHLPYWRQQIDSINERCDLRGLMLDEVRYKVNLSAYDIIQNQKEMNVSLGRGWKSLKGVCSQRGIMLHTVLQFVAHKVVQAYGNGKQSVVGTIVSGRDLQVDGIEEALGLFINTLPLIVDHEDLRAGSIEQGLESIQQKAIAMNMRACVELGKLTPGTMTHELFDCLLVLENYPATDKAKQSRLRDSLQLNVRTMSEKLTYPLVFVCKEDEEFGELDVTIRYAAELFSDGTIKDVLDVFESVFGQIAEKIEQPVTSLDFLGPRQLARLSSWNQSNVPYPHATLDKLFEEVVDESPNKVAVVYENERLLYTELNAKANQLARLLRRTVEAKPDRIVALFLEKNIDMFVCILAVWKAGMAYVPIDPSFPPDRVSFILEDTAALALLAKESLLARLKDVDCSEAIVMPVESSIEQASREVDGNLGPLAAPTDQAYVFYTSGTTGRPKGVVIEHFGVVNLQRSLCKTFGLRDTHDEVLLSFSNYTFDHFVEQMTDALLTGQTLLVLNDEMRADKERLYAYITRYRVTYLSGTPSVISMYEYDQFPWLRRIDCVGEDFSEPVFEKIRRGFDGLIINGYGPTEVSITTHKRLYLKGERRSNKSIGKQIDNSRTYVLNSDMKQVPIGAIGELYLGGDGVGRGYLNRPDLTEQRFPCNPFQSAEDRNIGRDSRLYKTGDLVRWLPNGEIEYLGREDFQIKLRGQRVELGEIEAAITAIESVVQSVVVPRSRKIENSVVEQKFLVGYFVSKKQQSEVDVKNELRQKLPEHLIPNRMIQIDDIPVTVSGKLDTKRLPAVDYATGTVLVSPINDTEMQLCQIWGTLLGLEPQTISVAEHFVTLGGDSLLSTKLSFEMSNHFLRRVTVADIFKHRTICSLADFILKEAPALKPVAPRLAHTASESCRASLAQERLLFIDRFLGGSNAYNVMKYLSLPKETSRVALRQALVILIKYHEALRTCLVPDEVSKQTMAEVLPTNSVDDDFLPLGEVHVGTQLELDELLDAEARITFDLQREPPIRMMLVRVDDPSLLVLAFNIHHTAFDAWSWNVLERDLAHFYEVCATTSKEPVLPPLSYSQAAYSQAQRDSLASHRGRELQGFWTQKLADYQTVELLVDFARPTTFNHEGGDFEVVLNADVVTSVQALAKTLHLTPFSILCSAYCLLLRAFTNQDDIVIGLPVANRADIELDGVIGCFMNMVALRIQVDANVNTESFMRHVYEEIQHAHAYQDYPFEELVRVLQVEYTPDRHPIFQHVFSSDIITAVAGRDVSCNQDHPGWTAEDYQPVHPVYSSSKVDLSTSVTNRNGKTIVNFNFPVALFEKDTIKRFAATYQLLLEQLISHDTHQLRIGGMALTPVSTTEKTENGPANSNGHDPNIGANGHTFSKSYLRTSGINGHAERGSEMKNLDYSVSEKCNLDSGSLVNGQSQQQTLDGLFEFWAHRRPNSIAVTSPTETVTYGKLHKRSNQLANFLHESDLSRGHFLGLMMKPCIDMIVCILAALKLGIGYVPMDPTAAPSERLRYMLRETSPSVILSRSTYQPVLELVSPPKTKLVLIDEFSVDSQIRSQSTEQTFDAMDNSNKLAYCIFTSGSTGRPKGCLIPQRNVVSFTNSLRRRYMHSSSLRSKIESVLMVSNYVFDFSVEQFALSIFSGNELVLLPEGVTGDDAFYKFIDRKGLYISGTPSVLAQLEFSRLHDLIMVTAAGEQLHASQFARMRQGFDGPINNAYGTTETTIYNLIQTFDTPDDEFVNSLGAPLEGQKIYVANGAMQPLPEGAVGELLIAGDCISDGYLNRPELTADRFVSNPFSHDEQYAILYRTGDMVRRLPDGRLEFRGRKDGQVKIRGFRVELDEIQAVLGEHPDVESCIVLPKSRKHAVSGHADFLVGYFTSKLHKFSLSEFEDFLAKRLPEPLIPKYLVQVPGQLPTTVTGKLDIERLPEFDSRVVDAQRTEPSTHDEKALCHLWSTMLGCEVGPDDDFFRCGGDSIMSLMFSRVVVDQCGLHINVKDVFEHRTIARILQHVDIHSNGMRECKTEQGILQGPVPLLPVQSWFFAKNLTCPDHWNQTFVIQCPRLDLDRLRLALTQLCEYHDALRLSYGWGGEDTVQQQYFPGPSEIDLHVVDCQSDNEPVTQLDSLQQTLRIGSGRLAVAAYLPSRDGGNRATIWMAVHHLAIDTESWRIIARDLQTLYEGRTLPAKRSSFRQWSETVATYTFSDTERKYWDNVNSSLSKFTFPVSSRHYPSSHSFALPEHDTQAISTAASRSLQLSTQDVLLTAFARAVFDQWQTPLAVTMEGHGREGLDSLDVIRTVGWFTTMYPFIVPHADDLLANIRAVKEALEGIPQKAIGYGPGYGYHDLPPVSFNYLGNIMIHSSKKESSWTVESGMDATKWGRSRSDDSQTANSNVLDVTAWIENKHLHVQLDGAFQLSIMQDLKQNMQSHLKAIIDLLNSPRPLSASASITQPMTIPETFVPYFVFTDPPRKGSTLFLFPPGEGGAESWFNNVVTVLPDVPLVVFNNVHLEHPQPSTQARFETLAKQYIAWLKSIQPTGPYHFLGWSFGGVLAFEIALQLSWSGDEVASLNLIDSYHDVSHISTVLGYTDDEAYDILDPINWYYHPDSRRCRNLTEKVKNVVLFKADRKNDRARNGRQENLFDWYDRSSLNGLDRLIDESNIQRIVLQGQTHFSWVTDCKAVEKVGDVLRSHLKE